MATVKNPWVGYLDRSYQQIKSSLLSKVTTSNPELTDHSESNPFIIIISMMAGVFEMLGLYVDNMAEETYMATANRFSSIVKHSRPIDYRIKARSAESVDILITWSEPVPSQFTIPAGAEIVSNGGIVFRTVEDYIVNAAVPSSNVPFIQVTLIENATFGVTDGTLNQKLSLGNNYVENSLQLTIGGLDYEEVKSFAYAGPFDLRYIIDVFEDNNAYIVLGDGINGILPAAALTIEAIYQTSLGPDGKVAAGDFDADSLNLGVALPGALTVDDANSLLNSVAGAFYEGVEDIRRNAPLSLRTLNRAVTLPDHEDVLELVSGVAKAKAKFCCGKTIDIYIAPIGGGVPSSILINAAQAEIEEKKMACTFPVVKPAGETRLVLGATVTAKKRKGITETTTQVVDALLEFGSIDNQDINGSIRLSDIQALIDNQTFVDFVDITKMYTKPYARPIAHVNALNWTNATTLQSIAKVRWRLEYDGTNIRVFKENEFKASIAIGVLYDDTAVSGFKFTVNAGGYASGNVWEFTTYPYLQNLFLDDNTLFTILEEDLDLVVVSAPTSTPNC